MIQIVPTKPTHIGPVASRVRAVDARECELCGLTVRAAIRYGMINGECWTALRDGRPEAIFGHVISSIASADARVWAIMTEDAMEEPRHILRVGRWYTESLRQSGFRLHNIALADNTAALRWLEYLGYTLGPVETINGFEARRFSICAAPQQ